MSKSTGNRKRCNWADEEVFNLINIIEENDILEVIDGQNRNKEVFVEIENELKLRDIEHDW